MELNGALSNPVETHKDLLKRLSELQRRAQTDAYNAPREPRRRTPRRRPLHETVRRVLEEAGRPMPTKDIRAAVEQLLEQPVLRTTLKAALAEGAAAEPPRFRRVRYGVYELIS